MPEGIAAAPDGSLIVADAGAQRIRRIDVSGTVTTVAGSGELDASGLWVPGGYRDGAAAQAQFNEPAAVAIAPDGAIIVADAANHCLRRISGGVVSTYAGDPSRAGAADGGLREATFERPMALAFDAAGTLYVGDYGVGVRAIAPAGKVSTLKALMLGHSPSVTGLDVVTSDGKPSLYTVVRDGVLVTDLAKNTSSLYRAPWERSDTIFIDGFNTIGWPFAIAVVGPLRFAFTDPLNNAVRYVAESLSGQVAGLPVENESYTGGDFRDGQGYDVRFDQPMGIAKWTDDRFVVADTGNRRIRVISGIDFRHQSDAGDLERDSAYYRIAYVGNSYAVYNQAWDQSIAGTIEAGLVPKWRALGLPRRPRVLPIEILGSLEAQSELIRLYMTSHLVDAVVWQVNSAEIDLVLGKIPPFNISHDPQAWSRRVTTILRGARDDARANGIPLVIAINPMSYEASPIEDTYSQFAATRPEPVANYAQVGSLIRAAAEKAGVPVVDLFGPVRSDELMPAGAGLFGTFDDHASVAGVRLTGNTILQYLLLQRPWASSGQRP